MELLMVRFEDEALAREGLARLEAAAGTEGLELSDLALVLRSEDDQVHIEQTHPSAPGRGAVRGALLGAALGIVTGGIGAMTAAGAAGGAVLGRRDRGIDDKVLRRIGQVIEGSEAVVFVAADAASVDRIAEHIDERRRRDLGYVVLSVEDEAALASALE